MLSRQSHIHFIGIGGIGMSALAFILKSRGYSISGSDQNQNNRVKTLESQGITIFPTQTGSNLQRIRFSDKSEVIVIISSAIKEDNPELIAAKQAKIKIWHRSDLLAQLIKNQDSIAVAGSHGKTTTSTLLTTLLATTKEDPTAVIGGIVPYYNSNGHAGEGKLLIAEADESDGSLIKFKPKLGVLTNLELDHTDHYPNLEALIKTITTFTNNCDEVLANYDCQNIRKHISATAWWSISTKEGVDFAALPKRLTGEKTIADLYENGQLIDEIIIPMPGIHNLSNTLAAIAACRMVGIKFTQLKEGLIHLKSPGRRFEFQGLWEERQIIDDYAHHPSEIKATLSIARLIIKTGESSLPKTPKRLVVAFQPHRYSRTKQFLKDFALSLGAADTILLAPIYSAGEKKIKGVNSQEIANLIRDNYPNIPVYVAQNLEELTMLVKTKTLENDLVLSMGAGDINTLWNRLNTPKGKKSWKQETLAA